MKVWKMICAAVVLSVPMAAQSQASIAADQVARLDSIVNLDKSQEKEIEGLLVASEDKTEQLSRKIQALKIQLGQEIGPDFDERSIRKHSKKLGELSGELTAETALLQAKIQTVLTEDQRALLLKRAQQIQPQSQAGSP